MLSKNLSPVLLQIYYINGTSNTLSYARDTYNRPRVGEVGIECGNQLSCRRQDTGDNNNYNLHIPHSCLNYESVF